MSIDPSTFRTTMGHYPTGVCVITSIGDDGRALGMTVGTFTSVSIDPPLIGFFPDKKSSSWPEIAATGKLCVNVLAQDQEWLGRRFAARDADRFADVVHDHSPSGLPILDGAVAWIDCSIHSVSDAGDHYLVLGAVESMAIERPAAPLVFHQGRFAHVATPVAV